MKYLFIANNDWFRFDDFVTDARGEIWWYHRPKSLMAGDNVYFYLSGKLKAVKYEFQVVQAKVPYRDSRLEYDHYWKYVDGSRITSTWVIASETHMAKLRLVRVLTDFGASSPARLKSDAKILGSLMSSRKLSPFATKYLDSVK